MRPGLIAAWLVGAIASFAAADEHGPGVHLLTMGPGPALWERFGHNALAVIDRESGVNVAYNYGIFDFDDPGFVARFLRGDMRYWMDSGETVLMIWPYFEQRRDVWGQELSLSPDRARALYAFLEHNALPENRYYTYNYYTDNCSTRVRDAIDHATDGQVRAQLQAINTGQTYRQHTRMAMSSNRIVGFGIDFSLSAYADRELNAWEASFLPVQLMTHLRSVTIESDGSRRPLVARERWLHEDESRRYRLPDHPPRAWPVPAVIGIGTGAILLMAARAAGRSRAARWTLAVLTGAWGLLAGVGGIYLLALWTLTNHRAAYANENLLHATPVTVALLVLGPLAAFGRARRIAAGIGLVLLAISLLGVLLKALPGFAQDNWNVIALALPLNAATAAGLTMLARRPTTIEKP